MNVDDFALFPAATEEAEKKKSERTDGRTDERTEGQVERQTDGEERGGEQAEDESGAPAHPLGRTFVRPPARRPPWMCASTHATIMHNGSARARSLVPLLLPSVGSRVRAHPSGTAAAPSSLPPSLSPSCSVRLMSCDSQSAQTEKEDYANRLCANFGKLARRPLASRAPSSGGVSGHRVLRLLLRSVREECCN